MQSIKNDFYVYLHRKGSNNSVFYVGKGCKDRAYSRKARNERWHRTVNKHGLIVEIIHSGLQDWYAMELEVETIARYGRKNLCNMTDGGDGTSGHIKSQETIEKYRASAIGKKRSDETRLKQSISATGRKMSAESIEKSAMHRRGRKLSSEHIEKVRKANTGKKRTKEQIERLRDSLSKVKRTPEWIEKMAASKRKKVRCVTTGMVFDGFRVAARWLSENGHEKASMRSIWKAANETHRIAYGCKWEYAEKLDDGRAYCSEECRDDHQIRISADKRNGR